MVVQRQPPLEIPFGGSLDEATGRLFRGPGRFRVLQNVEPSKAGYLGKRRGYRRVSMAAETGGGTPGVVIEAVATYQGELVVVGQSEIYGVHADEALETGSALTLRGPSLVGAWKRTDLVSGGIGD